MQFHGTGQVNHNSFSLNIAIICIKCQIGWKDKNVSANLNLENDLPKFPHEKKNHFDTFFASNIFFVYLSIKTHFTMHDYQVTLGKHNWLSQCRSITKTFT